MTFVKVVYTMTLDYTTKWMFPVTFYRMKMRLDESFLLTTRFHPTTVHNPRNPLVPTDTRRSGARFRD